MFSILSVAEGDKVDIWLLTDDSFDRIRFSRRIEVAALGMNLFVSTPEDTILAKLRWAMLSGGSEKQFRDCLRVYELQIDQLDIGYLEEWVERLGLRTLWARLISEAQP
jgi:hypothetical protein